MPTTYPSEPAGIASCTRHGKLDGLGAKQLGSGVKPLWDRLSSLAEKTDWKVGPTHAGGRPLCCCDGREVVYCLTVVCHCSVSFRPCVILPFGTAGTAVAPGQQARSETRDDLSLYDHTRA